MGWGFTSIRYHAPDITDRGGYPTVILLAGMAKSHSGEAFFGCDNPLEPVLFSGLVEIRKLQAGGGTVVDP